VTTSSAVAEDRLERPDRLPVGEPAHDPVALRPRIGGPLHGQPAEDASELLHRARPFPGECIQPFVGEDHGQLVGVLGLDRHQDKARGPDRRIHQRQPAGPGGRRDRLFGLILLLDRVVDGLERAVLGQLLAEHLRQLPHSLMAAEGTSVEEDHAVLGDVAPEVLLDDALNVFVGPPAVGDTQVVIEHFLCRALAQVLHPTSFRDQLP
jgi:hypothetical protein